jgi:glycosyltransferase involved in cell wall biosynthesis
MKNLLYIGNKLDHKDSNITTIDTLGEHLEDEGYHIIYSSSKTNKLFRLFDMVFTLNRNRNRLDFVLIDTYSTQNFYYALIISQLCRLFKLKYIPILHGGDLPKRLEKNPKFSNYIFKYSYINVSPSLYLEQIFKDQGFENIKHIPNSIEINNYPFTTKIIAKPKLFWLRSFKEIYNPLMAVYVAKKIIEKGFECELCMVGPDGDGSFLFAKKLARELNINVNFKLKMDKKEWIELSRTYNIFLNTTNFDNMPVSVIEAMALGFPIVSTNAGGMAKLIIHGKDGLLVDKNDIEGMTSQIIKLISNPKLTSELSKNARLKAEQFDWEVVKKEWNEILN